MTNRREFLQVGLAATTLTSLAPPLSALPLGSDQRLPLYKVIYDQRYQDSVRFAEHLAAELGGDQQKLLRGIDGDITAFWYQELHQVWQQQPVALAGMTAAGPLFCLEQLAWEKGMHVIWRGEHQQQAGGLLAHQLQGPAAVLQQARSGKLSLARADAKWCERVADLMLQCELSRGELARHSLTVPVSTAPQQDAAVDVLAAPLVSWIIAPRQRA